MTRVDAISSKRSHQVERDVRQTEHQTEAVRSVDETDNRKANPGPLDGAGDAATMGKSGVRRIRVESPSEVELTTGDVDPPETSANAGMQFTQDPHGTIQLHRTMATDADLVQTNEIATDEQTPAVGTDSLQALNGERGADEVKQNAVNALDKAIDRLEVGLESRKNSLNGEDYSERYLVLPDGKSLRVDNEINLGRNQYYDPTEEKSWNRIKTYSQERVDRMLASGHPPEELGPRKLLSYKGNQLTLYEGDGKYYTSPSALRLREARDAAETMDDRTWENAEKAREVYEEITQLSDDETITIEDLDNHTARELINKAWGIETQVTKKEDGSISFSIGGPQGNFTVSFKGNTASIDRQNDGTTDMSLTMNEDGSYTVSSPEFGVEDLTMIADSQGGVHIVEHPNEQLVVKPRNNPENGGENNGGDYEDGPEPNPGDGDGWGEKGDGAI